MRGGEREKRGGRYVSDTHRPHNGHLSGAHGHHTSDSRSHESCGVRGVK